MSVGIQSCMYIEDADCYAFMLCFSWDHIIDLEQYKKFFCIAVVVSVLVPIILIYVAVNAKERELQTDG